MATPWGLQQDMSEAVASERREVAYAGLVQGVGFRYTARQIARRYRVTGYVQNLADGRVWLVAEGTADELDRFLHALAAAMADNIRHTEVRVLAATNEFDHFGIRH